MPRMGYSADLLYRISLGGRVIMVIVVTTMKVKRAGLWVGCYLLVGGFR